MKKQILLPAFCLLGLLSGCFKDDSTLATEANRVHNITVEGLPQDTSAVASTTVLELTPSVPGFTDDELSFAWYIYGGQYEDKTPDGYRTVQIGDSKKLSYPVDLKIGTYTVVCEATHKATGYFGLVEFGLNVTSAFSNGFYALKETADGNSELDLYNHLEKTTVNDVITLVHGAPLAGVPRNMNTAFGKTYIDPATATSTSGTALFIANGPNDCVLYNTVDMSVMFDRTSLLFSDMEADEVPYAMATFYGNNYYLSSQGLRSDALAGSGLASEFATGQLAYPAGSGGSTFLQACDENSLSYWSSTDRRLMSTGGYEIEYPENYTGIQVPWDNAQPVASGWNWNLGDNTVWYLFDVPGDARYLVILDGQLISEVRRLDPTFAIAKSDIVAGKGKSGSFIYSVDGNRIYRYSLAEDTETLLPDVTLPQGAITYLANLFYSSAFDHLVIGVQNGADYSVVMYDMQGAQPSGNPVHTFHGTGTLRKICYVTHETPYMPNWYPFIYPDMSPNFPY